MKTRSRAAIFLAVLFALVILAAIFFVVPESTDSTVEQCDNNNSLVRQAGSAPASLANFQRRVVVKGFDTSNNGAEIFANVTLGWAVEEQDKNYIVVPLSAFIVDTPYGSVPVWMYQEIGLKAYLLPSPEEDDWKEEELGEIFINEDKHFAVIERTDPIIGIRADYEVGKYESLAVDDAIYLISQMNGRMDVTHMNVSSIFVDEQGRNLFNAPVGQEGGLAFQVCGGKFKLVGFLSVMEPSEQDFGQVYLYYQDVQQILDFIKTKLAK